MFRAQDIVVVAVAVVLDCCCRPKPWMTGVARAAAGEPRIDASAAVGREGIVWPLHQWPEWPYGAKRQGIYIRADTGWRGCLLAATAAKPGPRELG